MRCWYCAKLISLSWFVYFETQKQGQKLLAALNLPQVGAITLLKDDHVGRIKILCLDARVVANGVCRHYRRWPRSLYHELNERVYTIKARSHDEATFWVDALLWRQAGGVVTQKSPDVTKPKVGDQFDSVHSSTTSPTSRSKHVDMTNQYDVDIMTANLDVDVGNDGAPCAACCVIC